MGSGSRIFRRLFTLLLLVNLQVLGAEQEKPVAYLAKHVYILHTSQGEAAVPLEMSADPGANHPEITRAALVFHGKGRNVEGYFHALQRAAEGAGPMERQTLLLAPQFLREEDAKAHRLPSQFLRWHLGSWSAGEPASGPLPLSTFDVIDALLTALADRQKYPNLNTIVLIGHSGGGQLLNRYAIVGKAAALTGSGIHVRFVPAYVGDTSAPAWQNRERDYVGADVIYLLGTDDTDPAQADLDTSCAGEAQGPERLDRGKAYFRYLKNRHPEDLRHRLWFVPGVAHMGSRMVESPCAIAAVFDQGKCI
jgi:hypothetical protein